MGTIEERVQYSQKAAIHFNSVICLLINYSFIHPLKMHTPQITRSVQGLSNSLMSRRNTIDVLLETPHPYMNAVGPAMCV